MTTDEVRRFALSLPVVSEEPHHHFASFRVRGKIFATLPPDEVRLHVFVPEERRHVALATHPDAYEKLWWGKKVVGLRVILSKAKLADVESMLDCERGSKKGARSPLYTQRLGVAFTD